LKPGTDNKAMPPPSTELSLSRYVTIYGKQEESSRTTV